MPDTDVPIHRTFTINGLTDNERGVLIDALLGMRDVLAEPGAWAQGALALRRYETQDGRWIVVPGKVVPATSSDAGAWCLIGSAERLTLDNRTTVLVHGYLRDVLYRRFDWPSSLERWNDCNERTQDDVVGLIVTALDELKGAE